MKRTSLLATALLALGVVFATTGCATFGPSKAAAVKHNPTYALIVSVSGGQAPTDAQWATMQKKFGDLLANRGLVFVTDPTFADKLIQVLFVPDIDDPTTGTSYIVSVRDNPTNTLVTTSRVASTSYGSYTSASNLGFGYTGFQPQYYGYFPDYTYNDNTYTSTPATPTTPGGGTVTPPHIGGGHHTSRPVDCPPDDTRRPPNTTYAGNHPPSSRPSGESRWGGSGSRPEPSSSSYSSSTYSGGSSHSSDYAGPSTSYSSSASNSAPSISFSSSSSSSSSSYSAPSYSPPADTSSSSSSSNTSSSAPNDVIR
jgi:hypothetical protein